MIDYDQVYRDTKYTLDNELKSNRFMFADNLIKEGDSVLDIGCASGHLMKHITKKVDYFGVDVSKEAIKDNPHPSIIGNAESFKRKKKFDKIVCLEVLEHLENPAKAMKSMIRHLKPKGLIILTVPRGKMLMDKTHLHIFNLQDVVSLCSQFGRNYSIIPIKKYETNDRENLFAVVMGK